MRIAYVFFGTTLTVLVAAVCAFLCWNPGPRTDTVFDRGSNGMWIGHQWFSGREVRTGRTVTPVQLDSLLETVKKRRINYLFVHAGPVRTDGTTGNMPGMFAFRVRKLLPAGALLIPWLGGNANTLPLSDPTWRSAFITEVAKFHALGFPGVHLDFEPLRDAHPGYVDLLRELRTAFPAPFLISHATRRLSLFPVHLTIAGRWCWSKGFYRETMTYADQTVLMGYDTCIRSVKAYTWYVAFQTLTLARLAAGKPGHRLLIGIPSYEDVPLFSDPATENIRNASLGVRAGLERVGEEGRSCEGVAVYAHWVTDTTEWKQYDSYWLKR